METSPSTAKRAVTKHTFDTVTFATGTVFGFLAAIVVLAAGGMLRFW